MQALGRSGGLVYEDSVKDAHDQGNVFGTDIADLETLVNSPAPLDHRPDAGQAGLPRGAGADRPGRAGRLTGHAPVPIHALA